MFNLSRLIEINIIQITFEVKIFSLTCYTLHECTMLHDVNRVTTSSVRPFGKWIYLQLFWDSPIIIERKITQNTCNIFIGRPFHISFSLQFLMNLYFFINFFHCSAHLLCCWQIRMPFYLTSEQTRDKVVSVSYSWSFTA